MSLYSYLTDEEFLRHASAELTDPLAIELINRLGSKIEMLRIYKTLDKAFDINRGAAGEIKAARGMKT